MVRKQRCREESQNKKNDRNNNNKIGVKENRREFVVGCVMWESNFSSGSFVFIVVMEEKGDEAAGAATEEEQTRGVVR